MDRLAGGGQANKLMSELAADIALRDATRDKLESFASSQQDTNQASSMEEEDEIAEWRRKRISEMEAKRKEMQENVTVRRHGEYVEVTQDEFLPAVTGSKKVVCHFYHKDFPRCRIIDHHLRIIAQKHVETRFITINAEKAPFFIERLGIRVLPTLVLFEDGISRDRIIGYEGFAINDEFQTVALVKRLVKAKMITPKTEESDSDSDSN
ncbi:unnamed protein product [Blepharisma stoltei]|uniref:Thioredoxin domain-containing protein n=1 Tax=Blepharisma stoltei TaxID=1481888 RepID=A0AAU9K6T3_9CILI|nr:unnamed protein product [Blepharisma stoltei]